MADVYHSLALKRPDACQHLVEQDARGKDVRPLVSPLATGLLRSGVGRGPIGNSELRDLCPVDALVLLDLFVLQKFSEAEIEDLDLAALGDHHVPGLYVAMDDVL